MHAQASKWKLVEFLEGNVSVLFDLEADPGETVDLSSEHPATSAELLEKLHSWQREVDAPIPHVLNPSFNPCQRELVDKLGR